MRTHSIVPMFVMLVLAALSLFGCGANKAAAPTEVHIKLSEFKVEMDKTSIPAGPVKFIIENAGMAVHEVVLEPAGADDKPMEAGGKESEVENIEPGRSATLEWTIDKAGPYQLACHITGAEDHYAHGMVKAFTVSAL
jgi:uncharacterized cupredoxin-like copper-binding protein